MEGDRRILQAEKQANICHTDISIHKKGLFSELGKHRSEINRNGCLSSPTFSGCDCVNLYH